MERHLMQELQILLLLSFLSFFSSSYP